MSSKDFISVWKHGSVALFRGRCLREKRKAKTGCPHARGGIFLLAPPRLVPSGTRPPPACPAPADRCHQSDSTTARDQPTRRHVTAIFPIATPSELAARSQTQRSDRRARISNSIRPSPILLLRDTLRAAHPSAAMITKFMTEVTAKFNPFSACAKPARLFLTFLPPNARSHGTAIHTTLLPRTSTEPSSVKVKFSMSRA